MKDKNLDIFLMQLASAAPVPGGGGASALAAALAVALGNMVGSFTQGKKKYADVEEDILFLNSKAVKLRNDLIALIEKDAEVFEPLSRAYAINKDDPHRREVMAKCLKDAAEVPLEIMKKCCTIIDMLAEYAKKGSKLLISDAGCGAAMAKSALESAALNVMINTKSMEDRNLADSMNKKTCTMLDEYGKKAEKIYSQVLKGLING